MEQFPLPSALPLKFGRDLDALAQQLAAVEPSAVCAEGAPTRGRLDAARADHERICGRMIALQEELDWDVYRRYGLLTDEEAADLVAAPRISPGNSSWGSGHLRFVLAKRRRRGEGETQWFARHRSTPITEIPAHWPGEYRQSLSGGSSFIESNRNIGLIERPECKRRWQSEPWEEQGTGGPADLAAGPVRGAVAVVRAGRAAPGR